MKFIKIFEIFAINFLIVVSQQLNLKQQCNDIKAFFTNNQIITTENKNSCCGVFEISCGADKNNVNTVKFRTFEPKIIDFTQFPAVQNIEIIATSNILFNNNQLPKLLLDPNLKELDILNSNLNVVPNDIANLMKLEKLMINDSKITSVPYFLKNLPNLKYLSIRNNTMTISLTNEMSEFKTLETLDISVNRFEEPLVLPLNLKILKMEGCRMKTLDTEMLKQLHLVRLNINENAFDNPDLIFEKLTDLTDLKQLILSNNKVKKIPKLIKKMQDLEELDLNNNNIQVLPNELFELKKLNTIVLDNNMQLKGKFGFDYKIDNCKLEETNLCYTTKDVCNATSLVECDQDMINTTNNLINTIYSDTTNEAELNEDLNQKDKNNSILQSKTFIIAIIIIIIIVILFIVYFCLNKDNKNETIFIKDEDNNATYAYSDNKKSRQILNELNLSNSSIKKDKSFDEKITNQDTINQNLNNQNIINYNDSFNNIPFNNNNSNILFNNNNNNNININSNSNINLLNNGSPNNNETISPYINNSYGEINYNNNNSFNNDVGTSSNMVMSYNNSNDANGVSSSNQINLMKTVIDEEEIRLKAKIQKEMLATEEMLINKKAKDGNYKDDSDQPPPYTQF